MTHRDSNGITQRDKTCPVAVALGRDKSFIGLSLPIQPNAENTIEKFATGYVAPSRRHKWLSCLWKLTVGHAVLPPPLSYEAGAAGGDPPARRSNPSEQQPQQHPGRKRPARCGVNEDER